MDWVFPTQTKKLPQNKPAKTQGGGKLAAGVCIYMLLVYRYLAVTAHADTASRASDPVSEACMQSGGGGTECIRIRQPTSAWPVSVPARLHVAGPVFVNCTYIMSMVEYMMSGCYGC